MCVPVRNEEALLPQLLDAIAAQVEVPGVAVTLCLLLDACEDRSAEIATRFAATVPVRVRIAARNATGQPNAGRARRAAMRLGQAAMRGCRTAALLTTDADSRPARDWIAAACRSLAECDLVAGRIVRDADDTSPGQDRLEAYYDRLYALRRHHDPLAWEPAPGHHQVGGANLAFRAAAYRALGGFAPVPAGEDGAIVDAAERLGLRVRRDRAVLVETSGRHHGRAVRGLADHLRMLAEDAGNAAVAHPDVAAWQYRGHALARAIHPALGAAGAAAAARLADALEMPIEHVLAVAAAAPNAGAFATCVVPAPPGADRLVPLHVAEAALARLERDPYERAA